MKVFQTIDEVRREREGLGRLALVPTMGALHEGHRSLIEMARRRAQKTAVSIFVNPTQFGPREDFTRYPRPIEADLKLCEEMGVDLVFNPSPGEIYPPMSSNSAGEVGIGQENAKGGESGPVEIVIDLPALSGVLEGKHRPGHFKGVCQVVAKLFNIIRPDAACFGQKDFQQLRIITAMAEALNFPIEIVGCPTVRDADGLALSSRNRYLSADERRRALAIPQALKAAQEEWAGGVRQTNRLTASMQRLLLEQHLNIDYVAAVDPMTLKGVEIVAGPTVLAIAARVGKTRLIDNVTVGAD